MIITVQEARQRTITYLKAYVQASAITKDDGSTLADYIFAYDYPDYPISRVFNDKSVDLVCAIREPTSTALMNLDQTPYGYEESVPIDLIAIDKTGLTASEVKGKMEIEIRRVLEAHPTGSQRSLERRGGRTMRLGSHTLYVSTVVLKYRRDTT